MKATSAIEPGLDARVEFLRQPGSYPERSSRVEAIETHMSWVFLTDLHAYKLKKPVHYDYLDFSTLAARQHYCAEEVRLNRRLAESVYIGVVPLTLDAHWGLKLAGAGKVIDCLVKMHRLPAHQMLDYAITKRTVSAEDLRRIGRRLGRFYLTAPPIAIDEAEYRKRFADEMAENLHELSTATYGLPVDFVQEVCAAQHAILERTPEMFDDRVRAGKIIEGHGDLRPEHICLLSDLAIIDCLEFSFKLRTIDPLDDLGFLALECERLGAARLARPLLGAYFETGGDEPDSILLNFYQSYRACVRAKIAIRHMNERQFRNSPKWPLRALEYLRLADAHLHGCGEMTACSR